MDVRKTFPKRTNRFIILGAARVRFGQMYKFFFALFVTIYSAGCACHLPVRQPDAVNQPFGSVTLYGHDLGLRFSNPSLGHSNLLIVYATGDGGWGGLGDDLFSEISKWGYPAVGFSSKNYLKNLGYYSDSVTTTPRRFVRDLQTVIAAARSRLRLPFDTRVVLIGISRGAGLMVVAAGDRGFQSQIAGVMAIALTREEEHIVHARHNRRVASRELVEIKTYEYLKRLVDLPVAVIQSTHDGYLPAAAARQLFGPNTVYRKFYAVDARNHSFWCGCDELQASMDESWHWIRDFSSTHTAQ
jgi:pimeloyl-ACP methyl ester carboxylesterase